MDIAMIYRGGSPHPSHMGFAKAINADLLPLDQYSLPGSRLSHSIVEEVLNGAVVPDYDIFLVEGTRALYGAFAKQIVDNSILIYLAGDQALYKLLDESYKHESMLNRFISKFGMGALSYAFNRYIDGVIAVSDFSCEYTMQILKNKPSRIANPYIQPELFDQLGDVKPTLEKKKAITVGSHAKYKGQDLLVEAWKTVRKKHAGAELHLVGKDYPLWYNQVSGVSVHGYVDNLPQILESASLYVQPSRMDNFPVSVLEALRAGLPAVATETTGNSKIIERINKDLVVKANSDSLASGISRYFDYSFDQKEDLSNKSRLEGSNFDVNSRQKEFKSAFYELIEMIEP